MVHFIELQYFDAKTLSELRRKMFAASTEGTRWIEWTPALSSLCEQPDLTLTSPQHLGWREVAALANAAKGRQVVLVGDCQFTLGLSTVRQDFATNELIAFMPWADEETLNQTGAFCAYKLNYKSTMPALSA